MKYIPPNYPKGPKQLGITLDHLLMPEAGEVIDELAMQLMNETNGGPEWPKLGKFDGKSLRDMFDDAALDTKYVYVVNSNLPGLLAQLIALDHINVDKAAVRIIDGEISNLITVELCPRTQFSKL